MPNEYGLITGATSGLGLELCRLFHTHFPEHGLILVGRDHSRLLDVFEELSNLNPQKELAYFLCDLSKPLEVQSLVERIEKLEISHCFLVAGSGLSDEFSHGPSHLEEELILTTCLSTVVLARNVLLGGGEGTLGPSGKHLVFIASIASSSYCGIYCAAKAFVHTFANSLMNQFRNDAVNILLVSPGTMRTEFFSRIGMSIDQTPTIIVKEPQDVAKRIYKRLNSKPRGHLIPGAFPKVMWLMNRVLPRDLLMAIPRLVRNAIRFKSHR